MGLSPSEMPLIWASRSAESDRGVALGASSTQASRSPGLWARESLRCQVGMGSGRRGARAPGETGCGLCSLSQKELGPSNIFPPLWI